MTRLDWQRTKVAQIVKIRGAQSHEDLLPRQPSEEKGKKSVSRTQKARAKVSLKRKRLLELERKQLELGDVSSECAKRMAHEIKQLRSWLKLGKGEELKDA